jgi:ell wall binding domain 2 (CWB2)
MRVHPPQLAAVALALCVMASGCGKTLSEHATEPGSGRVPAVSAQGAGGLSTKNTTRLGGSESAIDAAAIAVAVYPGLIPATRPQAVVLVDGRDWAGALAASTLAGPPLHAPLLYDDRGALGEAGARALLTMRPTGAQALGGVQAIAIGSRTAPSGYRASSLVRNDPAALAVAIEQLASALRKRAPASLIVTAPDAAPAMTMPAAGLAAQAGAPILFVYRSGIPSATSAELKRLGKTSIYVVGPSSVVSERVASELGHYGAVTRIAGSDPASNAIAVSRFTNGSFGWGVVEPGHGLVFANAARPLDGPAAAPLSATGDYGPLLLLENPDRLPQALSGYLSDLQPGTPPSGPVHGVYNHGWLIGDASAISALTQASLDARLEISPRASSEPAITSGASPAGETGQTTTGP